MAVASGRWGRRMTFAGSSDRSVTPVSSCRGASGWPREVFARASRSVAAPEAAGAPRRRTS
jgi:hypothetical protein